jgi:hypothetical protein
MTLVLTIKVKEGLVLAADSRRNSMPPRDDAVKILSFKDERHRYVAALVSGTAAIDENDPRTPNELLHDQKRDEELRRERLPVEEYALCFHDWLRPHYEAEWEKHRKKIPMGTLVLPTTLHVAGFNVNEDIGRVLLGAHFRYSTEEPYFDDLTFRLNPAPNQRRPPEKMKGKVDCMIASGLTHVFQKAYKEHFSGHQKLIEDLPPVDGTWEVPNETSLQEAKTLICSLMGRTIYSQRDLKNAEIGGKICACTITPDDGLEMFDCDDFS